MESNRTLTAPLEEFTEVLVQLTDVVHSLIEIETQKAEAAADHQHGLINQFLNPEQAQILKLRGLEQKRMRLAAQLGWSGLTFRQILAQSDDALTARLTPYFIELDRRIKQLSEAKDACDAIIRLRLRELKTIIDLDGGPGYDGGKKPAAETPMHFQDKYV